MAWRQLRISLDQLYLTQKITGPKLEARGEVIPCPNDPHAYQPGRDSSGASGGIPGRLRAGGTGRAGDELANQRREGAVRARQLLENGEVVVASERNQPPGQPGPRPRRREGLRLAPQLGELGAAVDDAERPRAR